MKKFSLISSLFVVVFLVLYFLKIGNNNKFDNNTKDHINQESRTDSNSQFIISYAQLSNFYPGIIDSGHQIVSYSAFDLSYNEVHEQADWVIYLLTKEEASGIIERSDNFSEDKNIFTGSATIQDYKSSGYDRGHLAPAADMKWSVLSMNECFLMSNMSPQSPSFNRGIWKKLEEKVRDWAIENDSLIVITGPVFKELKGKIGKNEVSIPRYYFKVVMDISWPEYKAIAFLFKNEKADADLTDFAINIDSLEQFTGYNYFFCFKNSKMEQLEKNFNLSKWNFINP